MILDESHTQYQQMHTAHETSHTTHLLRKREGEKKINKEKKRQRKKGINSSSKVSMSL